MAKALDDSIRPAAALGPKQAIPWAASASASPAAIAVSGPDDHEVGGDLARQGELAGDVRGGDRADLRHSADARIAGRADQAGQQRRSGDLPGEGMFAAAAADHQDVHEATARTARRRHGQVWLAALGRGVRLAGRRLGRRDRQGDLEQRALALDAFDPQAALVAIDDVLDDGETKAGARVIAGAPAFDAVEALGQARQLGARDARPEIADRQDGARRAAALGRQQGHAAAEAVERPGQPRQIGLGAREPDGDRHRRARRAELDGVLDQVLRHLQHLVAVGRQDGRARRRQVEFQGNAAFGGQRLQRVGDVDHRQGEVDPAGGRDVFGQLDARQAHQVVDQPAHALGLSVHDGEEALARLGVVARVAAQGVDEAGQRGQGRAQLVTGVGEKVGAGPLAAANIGLVGEGDEGQRVGAVVGGRQRRRANPPQAVLAGGGLIGGGGDPALVERLVDRRQHIRGANCRAERAFVARQAQALARRRVGEQVASGVRIAARAATDQQQRLRQLVERLAKGAACDRDGAGAASVSLAPLVALRWAARRQPAPHKSGRHGREQRGGGQGRAQPREADHGEGHGHGGAQTAGQGEDREAGAGRGAVRLGRRHGCVASESL